MKCLSLLLVLLLLSCPPALSDTHLVTDEELDTIEKKAQEAQDQILVLQQLNTTVIQQYKQEQQRVKRYKTLSLVLGGVAIGLGTTIALREISK